MTNNLFELGLDWTDRFFLADTDSLIFDLADTNFYQKDQANTDTNFFQAKDNKPIPIFKEMTTMYYDKLNISLLSETNVVKFKIS